MQKPPAKEIDHHYAGIFLITDDGRVVGQRRDNKPEIDNPNKVGTFGGTVEENENAKEAVWRELTQEETNLTIPLDKINELCEDVSWRELTKEWEARHFYYAFISNAELKSLEVYEGQGWSYIKCPDDPELIASWRQPAKLLFEKLNLSR